MSARQLVTSPDIHKKAAVNRARVRGLRRPLSDILVFPLTTDVAVGSFLSDSAVVLR